MQSPGGWQATPSITKFLSVYIPHGNFKFNQNWITCFSVTDFASNDVHKLTFTRELGVPSDTHKRLKRLVFLKKIYKKNIWQDRIFSHKWTFGLFWYVLGQRVLSTLWLGLVRTNPTVKTFKSKEVRVLQYFFLAFCLCIKEKRPEQNFGN